MHVRYCQVTCPEITLDWFDADRVVCCMLFPRAARVCIGYTLQRTQHIIITDSGEGIKRQRRAPAVACAGPLAWHKHTHETRKGSAKSYYLLFYHTSSRPGPKAFVSLCVLGILISDALFCVLIGFLHCARINLRRTHHRRQGVSISMARAGFAVIGTSL